MGQTNNYSYIQASVTTDDLHNYVVSHIHTVKIL